MKVEDSIEKSFFVCVKYADSCVVLLERNELFWKFVVLEVIYCNGTRSNFINQSTCAERDGEHRFVCVGRHHARANQHGQIRQRTDDSEGS